MRRTLVICLLLAGGCDEPAAPEPDMLTLSSDPILEAQCPEGAHAYGGEPPTAYAFECRLPDGTPHGTSKTWFPDGKRQRLGEYENGLRTGSWTDFHREGTIKSEGRYSEDRRDGVWTFWHKSGRLEERTWFRAGQIETWDTKSLDP